MGANACTGRDGPCTDPAEQTQSCSIDGYAPATPSDGTASGNQVWLRKETAYRKKLWPAWLEDLKRSPQSVLFLHGAMGSELVDISSNAVAWLNLNTFWHNEALPLCKIDAEHGSVDSEGAILLAQKIVHFPLIGRAYSGVFEKDIKSAQFCYDWRDSAKVSSAYLAEFLRMAKADPELASRGINLVSHSLGCVVVMFLLGQTHEFDDLINSITFVSPAFGGSLAALHFLEYGRGVYDLVDRLLHVDSISATFPSNFESLPAPPGLWLQDLPPAKPSGDEPEGEWVHLHYPVMSGKSECSLFEAGALVSQHHMELRDDLLRVGREFHEKMAIYRNTVAERLGDRIHVIVALNSKTTFLARDGRKLSDTPEKNWVLHAYNGKPPGGMLLNGDGLVPFQSSFLPGIDRDRHWAVIPDVIGYSHARFMENPTVLAAVKGIIAFYEEFPPVRRGGKGKHQSRPNTPRARKIPSGYFTRHVSDGSKKNILAEQEEREAEEARAADRTRRIREVQERAEFLLEMSTRRSASDMLNGQKRGADNGNGNGNGDSSKVSTPRPVSSPDLSKLGLVKYSDFIGRIDFRKELHPLLHQKPRDDRGIPAEKVIDSPRTAAAIAEEQHESAASTAPISRLPSGDSSTRLPRLVSESLARETQLIPVEGAKPEMDYLQRARLREKYPPEEWSKLGIDPWDDEHNQPDHSVFERTHKASKGILSKDFKEGVDSAAKAFDISADYVRSHLLRLTALSNN